jgi:hypothetical protein
MEGIYETDEKFNFEKLTLLKPTQVAGGNYFIKFRINNNPLYVQPPKCKTKDSIVKAGKKIYCDLMFTNENEKFIQWMENLEIYCQKCIYENREQWFETELDNHDIENSFVSPFKLYKSGKYYIVRTTIPNVLGKSSLKIYDEYENEVDFETLKEHNDIMTILEIQGIKCSARSFQIEIEVKQMLLMKPSNIFEKCVIKHSYDNKGIIEDKQPTLPMSFDLNNNIIQSDTILPESNYENNLGENEENIEIKDLDENENMKNNDFTYDVNMENNGLDEKMNEEAEKDIYEIDFNLDEIAETETVQLKNRNDIYYKMYKDARQKAKEARDLALSSFLEAKRIKNTYMLDDIDSDSDLEEDSLNFQE